MLRSSPDSGDEQRNVLNLAGKCSDLCNQNVQNHEDATSYRILDFSCNPGIILQHIDRFVAALELNLYGCRLTTFTEEIANLANLTVLILSCNDLATIPQTIEKLSQLQVLDLSGNQRLKTLPPGIAQLKKLQVLNLGSCSFSELPSYISTLNSLEELDVSDNPLAARLTPNLPTRLRTLKAHGCALEGCWPEKNFESLATLQELFVGDNDFVLELCPVIGAAAVLSKLVVSFCDLTKLPDEIGQLLALEELDCSHNRRLTTLPTSFTALKKLRLLRLTRCSIERLPNDLGQLSALEDLDLSGNSAIDDLPTTIGNLLKLSRLSAAFCSLRWLPSSMEHLNKLQHLDLRNNRLANYPDCTLGMKNLSVLLLSNEQDYLNNVTEGNSIQVLPTKIVDTSLTQLDLHLNPMTHPPSVVCQEGIVAIRSYMKAVKDGAIEVFPGNTVNVLGFPGSERNDWVATLFGSGIRDSISVNGVLMTINDLTSLYCYPGLIPLFLTEVGTIIFAVELTEDALRSMSGVECFSPPEDAVRRWLLTMLCRLSQVHAVMVIVTQVALNATQLEEIERRLTQLVKNLVFDVSRQIVTFEANLESSSGPSKECVVRSFQQASAVLSAASVDVLVLRGSEDVPSQFIDYVNRKLCQKRGVNQPAIPKWWHSVRNKLVRELDEDCNMFSHMTFDKVLQIFNGHSPSGEEISSESTLCAILNLLSSTAQIVWMREHPVLGNYVFRRPRDLLSIMLSVLEHRKCMNVPACTKHFEQCRHGSISEEFLKHLLHVCFNTNLVAESAAVMKQSSDFATVLCDFMKVVGVFGEIQSSAADDRPQLVILSNLSEVKPLGVQMCCSKINLTVTIRMSFFGNVTPNGFFEACLSSALSIVSRLQVEPLLWRHGMFFKRDGITIMLRRLEDAVLVSACVSDPVFDIWGALYPLLQCLSSSIARQWKGIRPICSLMCPACVYNGMQDTLSAGPFRCWRLLPDIGHVQLNPTSSDKWTCSMHGIQVPAYLCCPRPPGCFSKEDKNAILIFMQCMANEEVKWDEQRTMIPERLSVRSPCIICSHTPEDDVLMSCLHKSHNDFSGGLSPALGRLGRLKKLELGYCNVASLPDSIGDLQQVNASDKAMSIPPPYPPLIIRRTVVRTQTPGQQFHSSQPGLRIVRHLASQAIPAAAIAEEAFAPRYPFSHCGPPAAYDTVVLQRASPIPVHVNGRAMGIPPPYLPFLYEADPFSYDADLQAQEAIIQRRQQVNSFRDHPSQQTPMFPDYSTLLSRQRSFASWTDDTLYYKLAEAGFFYNDSEALVTCFYCGLRTTDWRPTDDPFLAHARESKDCPFLLKTKGYDYVLAVSIAMADICGPKEEENPVSKVMEAQKLPDERMRSYDVKSNERLSGVQPSSQRSLGIRSAAAAPVSATGGRTHQVMHKVNWTAVSDHHAYEALRKSHYELTCKLNCKEVTAILFQNGILTENDMNLIQNMEVRSSMDARNYLLEVIRKKDKLGLKEFANALYTTKQHNLYDQVMNNLRALVPHAFERESST